MERVLHFINVIPTENVLRRCFKDADKNKTGTISKNDYINMLKQIF